MKLFRKQPDSPEPTGRRRPAATDTDERRPQAFSYYARRSIDPANSTRQPVDEATQLKPDKPAWAAGPPRLVRNALGLALLAGFVYCSMLVPNPTVEAVTSHGSAYFMQDTSVYQTAAAKALSSSILNYNKLTVDTATVSMKLTNDYPEIQNVSVVIPIISRRPIVRIQPYQPSVMLTTSHNTAYLLDTNGRALVAASQITDSGELSAPTLKDPSTSDIRLGSQVLPASTVAFVSQVTAILQAAKVGYGDLNLPAGTSELDVPITGKPYLVKFNLEDDPRQQAGTFLATQQRLEHDNVTPAQYIDVRLAGRAYYK